MKKILKQVNFSKIFLAISIIIAITTVIFLYREHYHQDFIRIDAITDVLKYTKKTDLVIFDIDWTLITNLSKDEAGNVIGWSNRSYFYALDKYVIDSMLQKHGSQIRQAVRQAGVNASDTRVNETFRNYLMHVAFPANIFHQYIAPHQISVPVENETIAVLKKLQEQQVPVLLYTSRGWHDNVRTEKELAQARIIINKDAIYNKQLVVEPQHNMERGFGFANGILYWIRNKSYTGPQDFSKGPVLLMFFDEINYHPKKIVFVDDMKERITGLKTLFKAHDIDATVLWYRGIEKQQKPIHELSKPDLQVLNSYLPKDWQNLAFDLQKTVNFIANKLTEKNIKAVDTALPVKF